jgi:hypothetical protein
VTYLDSYYVFPTNIFFEKAIQGWQTPRSKFNGMIESFEIKSLFILGPQERVVGESKAMD